MNEEYGKHLWPPRMRRRDASKERVRAVWMKLLEIPWIVRVACLLTLLVLTVSLVGCATPSGPPTNSAKNPQAPQLSEPLPSESYLQQALKLIESWRNAVTGM
jgi:hypothetical protein